jgi:hypothetical protein
MVLFEPLVLRGETDPAWRRRRSRIILGAISLALLATLAEPVLQAITGEGATLASALWGLPSGWWWRPVMLVPLAALAGALTFLRRDRITTPVAAIGAALALGSLLGLVFTSHAAGRESLRWPALASSVLHQWSTALWIGGLVALVVWLPTRRDATPLPGIDLRRFSTLALALFAIATLTGIVNAGFVLLTGPGGQAWAAAGRAAVPDLGADLRVLTVGDQVQDVGGVFADAFGIAEDGAVLVRPDGFVAWRRPRPTEDPARELSRVLTRVLHRPTNTVGGTRCAS